MSETPAEVVDSLRELLGNRDCPQCGSSPSEHEVRDFDKVWRDGKVYCKKCDTFVRLFDQG